MSSQHDDDDRSESPGSSGPTESDGPDDEALLVGASQAYTPPPSPAYALTPTSPPSYHARATPAEVPTDTGTPASAPLPPPTAGPTAGPPAIDRTTQRGWQLLLVGVALLFVAAVAVGAVVMTGEDNPNYEFGEVGEVSGGAVVRAGDGEPARPLEAGETVLAGWTIEAPDNASVTVDLAAGGVARLDSGATLVFVDQAVDPETGDRTGESEPALRVGEGRVWINPAGPEAAATVDVQIPGGGVESSGNPVAVDCTATCTLEAPAGGVVVRTSRGTTVTPAALEVVTVAAAESFDLAVSDAASAWATENLEADEAAGLPDPRPDDAPGIVDSAILDGAYAMALEVVGAPTGDAIPTALQYPAGETYTLELVADGSACDPGSCPVPVSLTDGATGTARVADGVVDLTFSQPIDCYDEAYTSVVVPGIGTTTVTATLQVGDVDHDGERWVVRTFEGDGTVAAALTTPCNPGDTLGTSTSAVTIGGN